MNIIEDKTKKPNIEEMFNLINNPLFNKLFNYINDNYKMKYVIEYSGDKVLLGWNIKFKKSGKTLCTVYPKDKYYKLLLIVGKKEKERVENIMPNLTNTFKDVYQNTIEGMGQRWMIFTIIDDEMLLNDIFKIIKIRSKDN